MQNPPCSIDDEKWKKYESYRPILHLTMCQLHVTLQKFQNDVNEIISKNSQLSQFIANVLSLPIENIKQYVTLHLHPFTSNETDNYDEIFRRTMQYVENCLLSGCPGNNLTQLLAHHTLQKEEEIFRKFLHRNNNNQHIKLTLDETKCHIIRQLSTLEKAKRVTSINNYQSIVTAIAKEINKTDEYRKIRQIDLITMRKLVSELEKTQLDYQKRLERYAKLFEKI